jgi:hypothetical protein
MTVEAKVRHWCERFRKHPLARRIVGGLPRRSAEIWRRTFELLQQESPEYRSSVDEEFTKESRAHCGQLLRAIVAVSAGRIHTTDGDPFAFVRTHAEWRARRQVPLVASLHAYRLAHKTYWGITQESLLHAGSKEALACISMLSDFWMEFFDHVGAVLAEAHAEQESMTVAQSNRAYAALIDDLLRGRQPRNAEARGLANLCGIRAGHPLAVAVARPFTPGGSKRADLEVTLRSLVPFIQNALPSAAFGKLADVRNHEAIVIVSGCSDTARAFIKAMRRGGFGKRAPAGLEVGIGVSRDALELAGLPDCLEEARHAAEFTASARPLVHFDEIDLAEFLVRRADPAAHRLIPSTLRELTPDLAETVQVFADCSLNVKQTARSLGVHTNTVYFRLNRVRKLTGIDARTFAGVSLVVTALRLRSCR